MKQAWEMSNSLGRIRNPEQRASIARERASCSLR
jgi:hypothetical protein